MGIHGTAQALVVSQLNGPFEVKEVQLSDDLRAEELIVRMVATSVCHTDVASAKGIRPPAPPAVYGHEGAGVVEKVGKDVKHIVAGDHVILTFNSCGSCTPCLRNQPSYCKHGYDLTFGGQRLDGTKTLFLNGQPLASNYFGQSSFSSRSVVSASSAVKVDKGLPLEILCTLGCGIQTGAGTVVTVLNPRIGSTVAVYGGGGAVGLASVAVAARCTPATKIIAIDVDDRRLEMAQEFGATHTINSVTQDTKQLIREITDGEGADYSVDTTGIIPVIQSMIASAAQNGVCATVGSAPVGATVEIEPAAWIGSGMSYVGSCVGSAVPAVVNSRHTTGTKMGFAGHHARGRRGDDRNTLRLGRADTTSHAIRLTPPPSTTSPKSAIPLCTDHVKVHPIRRTRSLC